MQSSNNLHQQHGAVALAGSWGCEFHEEVGKRKLCIPENIVNIKYTIKKYLCYIKFGKNYSLWNYSIFPTLVCMKIENVT